MMTVKAGKRAEAQNGRRMTEARCRRVKHAPLVEAHQAPAFREGPFTALTLVKVFVPRVCRHPARGEFGGEKSVQGGLSIIGARKRFTHRTVLCQAAQPAEAAPTD